MFQRIGYLKHILNLLGYFLPRRFFNKNRNQVIVMIQIFCIQDNINKDLREIMDHIDLVEDEILLTTQKGENISKDTIVDLCVSRAMVDELLRLRRKGL